jgi:hypothetical protein
VPPPAAYREVSLHGLSRTGHLDGLRVTTNATAAKRRVRRPSLDFRVTSRERGFEEVMVYHHLDSVLRHLESLGFRAAERSLPRRYELT